MNKDFFNEGKSDGYNYGTQERCDNKIKLIKANFLLELDKIIDEKNNVIELLKLQLKDTENSWQLKADGSYKLLKTKHGKDSFNEIYEYLKKKDSVKKELVFKPVKKKK